RTARRHPQHQEATMSVTFFAEPAESDYAGWTVVHAGSGDRSTVVFADRASAVAALAEHNETCDREMCEIYDGDVEAVKTVDAPSGNVSNVNARLLLDALGFGGHDEPVDLCGQSTPDDFLGRVLLAEAVSPVDEGVPAHALPGPGASVVDCDRHPGYLGERLAQLRAVADWCGRHRRTVRWS